MKFNISPSLSINPNYKLILLPVGALAFLTILLIVVINISYSQITSQMTDLEKSRKLETLMQTKIQVLREIEEGILEYHNVSKLAVPDENSILWVGSQLRRLAVENAIAINSMEISNATIVEGQKLKVVKINAEVIGTALSLTEYVINIKDISPIASVDVIDMEIDDGLYVANLEISTNWEELPTQLPALNEPIKTLTAKEIETLGNLFKLDKPQFTVLSPSKQDNPRDDPFNL